MFSQRHQNHHYGFNGKFQITIAPTFPYIATQRQNVQQQQLHNIYETEFNPSSDFLNESIIEIGDGIRSVLGLVRSSEGSGKCCYSMAMTAVAL